MLMFAILTLLLNADITRVSIQDCTLARLSTLPCRAGFLMDFSRFSDIVQLAACLALISNECSGKLFLVVSATRTGSDCSLIES